MPGTGFSGMCLLASSSQLQSEMSTHHTGSSSTTLVHIAPYHFAQLLNTMSARFLAWIVLLLVLVVSLFDPSMAQGKKFACSYSPQKANSIGYQPEYIPLEVCTHVIFKSFDFPSFVGRQMLFSDNDKIAFSRVLTSVRKRSNSVRVVASIDGSSRAFTTTSGTLARRKAFVQAATALLLELDADTIELNWRVSYSSDASTDRVTMITLLQDLRQAVNSANRSIKNRNRELWLRGSLHPNAISDTYNVFDVCDLVDHVTLDPTTADNLENAHAPLYGTPIVLPAVAQTFIKLYGGVINPKTGFYETTQQWLDDGCPPKKLLLGIGLYGVRKEYSARTRALVGDRATIPPAEAKYLQHYELCKTIREAGWTVGWDQYGFMPFVTRALQNDMEERISYEDLNSLRFKMDLVAEKRFGGVYIDYIHSDDIYGNCGQAYSLTGYLYNRVRSIPSDIGFAIEWN
ncbi:endochitinase-like [Anopheles stephensi]|uniref:endochitinase-like n=1 Tax=Anopheles stephensi TaxID=30069 RepID=UPI00165891F4|nr:endochitinase-like [Anopheles stephensi]